MLDKKIGELPVKAALSNGLVLAIYDPATETTYQISVDVVSPSSAGVTGALNALQTADKTNLVAAINEVLGAIAAKATTAEINTGTDNAKFATPLALESSKYLTQSGTKISATASGTNTYAAVISPAITALTAGQRWFITFTNANTGAATLALNGLAAKPIVKSGNTTLASGDIVAGSVLLLAYDGTNYQIVGSVAVSVTETTFDYTPADSDNTNGIFKTLLTAGKLKLKNALDRIVTVLTLANTLPIPFRCDPDNGNLSIEQTFKGIVASVTEDRTATDGTGVSAGSFTYQYKLSSSGVWSSAVSLAALETQIKGNTASTVIAIRAISSITTTPTTSLLTIKRY